jgi:hypothetical protein
VTLASCALILFCAAAGAQETKKEVVTRNFEIISVDGNRVVYRTDAGTKEITLADDFKRRKIEQISMLLQGALKAGMKGTAYLTTTDDTGRRDRGPRRGGARGGGQRCHREGKERQPQVHAR